MFFSFFRTVESVGRLSPKGSELIIALDDIKIRAAQGILHGTLRALDGTCHLGIFH